MWVASQWKAINRRIKIWLDNCWCQSAQELRIVLDQCKIVPHLDIKTKKWTDKYNNGSERLLRECKLCSCRVFQLVEIWEAFRSTSSSSKRTLRSHRSKMSEKVLKKIFPSLYLWGETWTDSVDHFRPSHWFACFPVKRPTGIERKRR